jgi:hypothetical protein
MDPSQIAVPQIIGVVARRDESPGGPEYPHVAKPSLVAAGLTVHRRPCPAGQAKMPRHLGQKQPADRAAGR